MTGISWPQATMGALILLIGLLAMRYGLTGGEVRWYGRSGAGPGDLLPFGGGILMVAGAGVAALGVYVLIQTFR